MANEVLDELLHGDPDRAVRLLLFFLSFYLMYPGITQKALDETTLKAKPHMLKFLSQALDQHFPWDHHDHQHPGPNLETSI